MRKIIKCCSIMLILLGIVVLASCKGKTSGIKGTLRYEAKRNEIKAIAEFDENSKLQEDGTIVSIKIYDENENFKNSERAYVTNNISASVTFKDLKQNTKYILKLFVSIKGYEEELYKLEASTKNDGTSDESAISIKTISEFKAMANDREAYYKLDADLDFSEESDLSIFTESTPFAGKFDGNDHTIKNVKLSAKKDSGIFGYLSEATVKNLKVEKVSLTTSSSVQNAGAIAGTMDSSTLENITISEIKIEGTTTTSSNNLFVGGFIGLTKTKGTIKNCKVTEVDFNIAGVRTSKMFSYGLFIGNLAGEVEVTNCSSKGNLKAALKSAGELYIGGFIGANSSLAVVKDCYTIVDIAINRDKTSSNVAKQLYIGGFVGGNPGSNQCNLENCLTISDIVVMADSDETTAKTIKLADVVRIAGVAGSISNAANGVKSCVYSPKSEGIKVVCLVSGKTEEGTTTYSDILISLTIAYSKVNPEKVSLVMAVANQMTFDFVLQITEKNEEGQTVTNTIEDEAELTKIAGDCMDKTSFSIDAVQYLSESLKAVYNAFILEQENRA